MAGNPNHHQFFVDEDGRVHEATVAEAVRRLKELFPDVDVVSLEAEIMIERSHRLLAIDRDAQWAPYRLTGSRFILLRSLYTTAAKGLTMGQIATQMNLEPNNVTQLVDALVRDGLVERESAEDDRRVVYACITPSGEALFSQVMKGGAERVSDAFSVLNPRERQTLSHLLAKLRMHLLANASRLENDHSSDRNRVAKGSGAVATPKARSKPRNG